MKTKHVLLAVILSFLVAAAAKLSLFAQQPEGSIGPPPPDILSDFNVHVAQYESLRSPKFPKSWRLVGVSRGTKVNETNLWFQNASQDIFMVTGFMDDIDFVLEPNINEIKR